MNLIFLSELSFKKKDEFASVFLLLTFIMNLPFERNQEKNFCFEIVNVKICEYDIRVAAVVT